MFDSIDFTRLCKSQWKVLAELRKMSDHLELIWCRGNHDIGAEMVAHLIGATLVDEYIFEDILVMHGHVFDRFIGTYPKLTWWADLVYMCLQRISMKLARYVKYQSKTFLRCSELIKTRAREYAGSKDCKYVCCGHTHHAEEAFNYFNSGCWTEDKCHYLVVEWGEVKLREAI